jgi:hypothetical protein
MPALRRLRQENREFKVNLGHVNKVSSLAEYEEEEKETYVLESYDSCFDQKAF